MLDIAIIAIYMAITFIIGIYYGRGTHTTRDYAIAGRKYGSFVLTMTFIATSFGAGSTVGDAAKVATDGIIFILSMVGAWGVCFYIQRYARRYFDERFADMISAGDIMKRFYGVGAEQTTAILGFVVSATTVGGQLTAVGNLFSYISDLSYQDVVLISAAVVIFYVTFGGIKAVATTDVLQFCIIVTVIPYLAWWMVDQSGGISNLIAHTPAEKFAVFTHPKIAEYSFLFVCSWMPFLWTNPSLIQRFLMTRTHTQIQHIFRTELTMRILFSCLMILIGFSGSYLFPEVAPKKMLAAVVSTALPDGMRGLLIVAVLAASMSTADSHLNTASILLTHNLLCRAATSERIRLNMMRLATVLIGIGATYIAMHDFDIIELILTGFSVWGGGIMVPMFGGVLRRPCPRYSFYAPVLMAVLTCIICQVVGVKGFLTPSFTVLGGLGGYVTSQLYFWITCSRRKTA